MNHAAPHLPVVTPRPTVVHLVPTFTTPLDRIALLFVLGTVLIFCLRKIFGQLGSGLSVPMVRRVPFMTPAERRVIGYIEQILPQARVHAQVSMGAIIQPSRILAPRNALIARSRFSSKRVDFLLEDRVTGSIIAIIELDDWSHRTRNDAWRDHLTASAGYRTIRLPADERPTLKNVRRHIVSALYEASANL